MNPIVNGLEKKYGRDLKIRRVDIKTGRGKDLARQHGVFGQPTFILFDSGEQVRKLAGAQSVETFEQTIERILDR